MKIVIRKYITCKEKEDGNLAMFIFYFISNALGNWPKKTLVRFMSENVLSMFFSRSFMVSFLIFKSLNHFEFTFVYGMKVYSNFIHLHAAV